MSLQRLPTELKLQLLGFLELQSLASLRNTCRSWFDLIQNNLTQPRVIPSARAELLRLYLDLHKFESFKASRKHIVPYIKSFPRQEYLDRLRPKLAEESNWSIPDQFSTWILEWPRNAVIGWVWPGLDNKFNSEAHWWRAYGSNELRWTLQGSSLASTDFDDALHIIVHDHASGCTTTICFDNDPKLHGTVWEGGAFDYVVDKNDLDNPNWYGHKWLKRDWVTWLREELDLIEMQYNPWKWARKRVSE